ncbi:MAG TPA: aldo/keto reductase [Candidatus Melainabacteria bacterium]|nr:aldo/keto reductase [Candidatus Melainabacteria bacterium]
MAVSEIAKKKFGCLDIDVPILGQGTWEIERADRKEAVKALQLGIDLGMTHVDTAEMYGGGEAEAIVAEAIAGRRDEVFLVSKVLPSNASAKGAIAACEKSLKRLNTDRLDCYLLHWRGQYKLSDTIQAFEQLKRDGKILSWGVSNFDTDDLDEALVIAGEGKIACNQVLYHLKERAIEHAVIPWCQKHDVAVVGYSPFGSRGGFPERNSAGYKVLQQVAAVHECSVHQVALSFLTRQSLLFSIPKAAKPDHAADNAAAARLLLTKEQLQQIDEAFPIGRKPRSLPMI